MLSNLLLDLLRNNDFATGWNCGNFYAILFRSIYAIFWSVWNKFIRSYPFLGVNFNAVRIVRTATIPPTCFSICFQICWEIRILRQVEIVVILMPIIFCSIYICYRLVSMKWHHFLNMLLNWLSNLLRNKDLATGWNRCNSNANFFA